MSSADGPERGIQTRNCEAILFVSRVEGKPRVANRRSVTTAKREAAVSSADGPERGIQIRNCEAILFVSRVEGKPHVANRRSVTTAKREAAVSNVTAAQRRPYGRRIFVRKISKIPLAVFGEISYNRVTKMTKR